MKPPQSYYFQSIFPRYCTKIKPSYPFRSIYPRVRTKMTPYHTHQPTLMSPRYSNVPASIRELIIRYASNNFRFIILVPTQRTSKSAPRFLLEKQERKHASTPMHRLPQCHLRNPELSAKTYIKWINTIPHCHHEYSIARHISSVLKYKKVLIW